MGITEVTLCWFWGWLQQWEFCAPSTSGWYCFAADHGYFAMSAPQCRALTMWQPFLGCWADGWTTNTPVLLTWRCRLLPSVCQQEKGWMKGLWPSFVQHSGFKPFSPTGSKRQHSNLRWQETSCCGAFVRMCMLIYPRQKDTSPCVWNEMSLMAFDSELPPAVWNRLRM